MDKFDGVEVVYGRPIYLMAKPVGAACNLRCDYCYYLEKQGLFDSASHLMSDETLERFVKEYIESQTTTRPRAWW